MNGWNGGMAWEGWLFMAFFWVVLLVVIVWAVTRLFPGRGEHHVATVGGPTLPAVDEPRAILARRLASGEIDADAYEELRRTLAGGER